MAVITGASGGLGNEYVHHFINEGYYVIALGRDKYKLGVLEQSVSNQLKKNLICVEADLAKQADLNEVLKTIQSLHRIDYFISAAGFAVPVAFDTGKIDRQLEQVDVQISATVKLVYAVLQIMNEQNFGNIILVSSTMGYYCVPGNTVHCATKSFINTFAQSLAAELKFTGIKVQALAPGMMHTGFHSTEEFKALKRASLGPEWMFMEPKRVAEYSLKNMDSKKVVIIPGIINRLMVRIYPIMNYIFSKIVMKDNLGRRRRDIC